MNDLEQRLRAALRVVRIGGQTVNLCPFCKRSGIELADGYHCKRCNARGNYETLAIYVPVEEERTR